MKRIATRHGTVALRITGSGPPLVLLHSGGHDRRDFDAVVPALAEHHQTIAIDLPGHGESDMFDPPSSARAAAMCEAAREAVASLGLPPAIWLGNSVGGMACLHAAVRAPDRVRALVLVSPSGMVEQTAAMRALCWLQGRELVRRTTGMAFTRFYLRRKSPEARAVLARIERARARPELIAMEAALWRSFADPSCDLSGEVVAIRCPVLLVWGRHDPVLRARVEGARARALLPHAGWIELDTGHVPFVEDPDGFLAAVTPFLRVCSRPAVSGTRASRAAGAAATGEPR